MVGSSKVTQIGVGQSGSPFTGASLCTLKVQQRGHSSWSQVFPGGTLDQETPAEQQVQ